MSQRPLSELSTLIEPICKAHGIELVDVRFLQEPKGRLIRVIIDRPMEASQSAAPVGSGVSIEDCEEIIRDVSAALDTYFDSDASYRLEVSTPGLNRPLIKLNDFSRFAGQTVKIHTEEPVAGRRVFTGRLEGVEGSNVRLTPMKDADHKKNKPAQDDASQMLITIPFEAIRKAHVVYQFD